MRLVLASTSPSRRAVLAAAHIRHEVIAPQVDEDAALVAAEAGGELDLPGKVSVLARAKALDVAERLVADGGELPDYVLGCDSLFELDGVALGKPHTPEVARERLRHMAGRAGLLHTGHCLVVLRDGAVANILEAPRVSTVVVADLTDAEIDAYVSTGEPLHVAGSFTLEGYGGPFIERIEGDHHNVLGLSLPALRSLIARTARSITELWQSTN
ncbi:septum formation protein Maf [Bowdeniella nasicola]|uniref:Nucleoside triphosphate pyrophosphatase n=1 Tax=Bowdeniella nasicola TaxID=208480 RepID=A0A1Q5Q2Y9_9ACTO|nr:nucleoside triphosphate pyrophosphatase [Bowdeniella nasicola]OKL54022.1 septum formation protein Maf [Bowdeniella nasicola]